MAEETDTLLSQGNTNDSENQGSADQNSQSSSTQDTGTQGTENLIDGQQDTESGDKDNQSSENAPESYMDFMLPDGMTMNKELLDKFVPIAKAQNMNQEKAQQVIDLYSKAVQADVTQQTKQLDDISKQWVDKAKQHPHFGGVQYEASKKSANAFVNQFLPSEAKKLLVESRFGNNPDLWAGFVNAGNHIQKLTAKIKELTGEDVFIPGGKQLKKSTVMYENSPELVKD